MKRLVVLVLSLVLGLTAVFAAPKSYSFNDKDFGNVTFYYDDESTSKEYSFNDVYSYLSLENANMKDQIISQNDMPIRTYFSENGGLPNDVKALLVKFGSAVLITPYNDSMYIKSYVFNGADKSYWIYSYVLAKETK